MQKTLSYIHEMIFGVKPLKGFIASCIVLCILLIIGTLFYHFNEHWQYLDAFYFSATTITTLGSNMYPSNPVSKIFTIIYIFFGIGIGALILSSIAKVILISRDTRLKQIRNILQNINNKLPGR